MAVGAFRDLEQSYRDLRWHLDPVAATQAGVPTYDDRFGRYSSAALVPHLAALKSLAVALEAVDTGSLDEEIDRTALLNDVRVTLRRFERERPQAKNPGFWLSHLLGGLHFLMQRRDRTPEARSRALLGRLQDVPAFLDDARGALLEPVQVLADTALRVCDGGIELIDTIGSAVELRDAADGAIAALRSFRGDVERWVDMGSEHFALGEEDFNFRLHYEHALRESAPELLRFGEALVRTQEAELTRRAEVLAPGVPWRDLVRRLRRDHPPRTTLVAEYAEAMERARRFVSERDLMSVPAGKLEVVATPPFMQPLIPFAAYDPPGAFAPDRTGWFYVSVPEEAQLREHSVHELATTSLHEGYPGHHVQFLAAQAQPSPVRKVLGTSLTTEGWALYCEQMMGEEGYYARPEEAFFQQMHMLWRAVRVVLDVRLHTCGMTVEQAVRYMTETLDLARPSAEAEVRRYCCNPGQALCYAVGCHELMRLRDDWRRRAGSAFSLKRFHDEALSYGGLPVSLMRWGMGLGEGEK